MIKQSNINNIQNDLLIIKTLSKEFKVRYKNDPHIRTFMTKCLVIDDFDNYFETGTNLKIKNIKVIKFYDKNSNNKFVYKY